ncbi:hypothetical protein L596_028189 [Steinernema carpocapsae]|uniref:C-type lectin domain-containing protein n=1 Tax=Steinernema carpocapsae TaxID=34508 RepID=A0A4U5LXP9_STECR|nr:hypothetical protein L596_028189 [Steinernema carpocapsae]
MFWSHQAGPLCHYTNQGIYDQCPTESQPATIESAPENEFLGVVTVTDLTNTFTNSGGLLPVGYGAVIGLRIPEDMPYTVGQYRGNRDAFKWIAPSRTSYENWYSTQPLDDMGHETVVALVSWLGDWKYKWGDVAPTYPNNIGYVACVMEPTHQNLDSLADCQPCDSQRVKTV